MIKLSRIIKDYKESGALHALVGIEAALDEHTFLTKGGDLVTLLSARGVDYECLDAAQLDQIAKRFESAARLFGPDFRIYQYLVKQDHPPIPHDTYEDPVVEKAVASRSEYLRDKAGQLYSVEIHFAIVYEGWKPHTVTRANWSGLQNVLNAFRRVFSTRTRIAALDDSLDRARETLAQKAMGLAVQLQDSVCVERLDKQRAFRFLRGLVNYAPHKAGGVQLKYDRFLDFQACDSELECHRDHLCLDDFYVKVLTLKEPPAQTFAHMFRALLEIPCQFIIANEWKRAANGEVRRLIQAKRRHFHNSKSSFLNYLTSGAQTQPKDMLIDGSAVAHVNDLGACLEELDVKGRFFGRWALSVVLYDRDQARLKRSVAECFKVFAAHDAHLTEESYNLLNAWLAVLPGNSAYNLRRLWLLDTNYADLSFLFTLRPGEPRSPHLGAEYLAVLETNHGTPYFLNLHHQDNGHWLILGETGSGKSFLLNFLLTHLQKYHPLTYVFDLGGGYENLTRLFGGASLRVGIEKPALSINPFTLPPTKENLQFLYSFLKVLIESGTYRMSSQDDRDLFEQIENLYVIEPDHRRLLTLSNMLSRSLRAQLGKWVEGGVYGSLFDHVTDNLTFARFQAFDFEGMDKVPQILEPLLFYILHRASMAIQEAEATRLKIFVMDEAWRFLRHPTIRQYILEALKTWRKKSAAMILATQSIDDLVRSEMLSVVVESCATKVFLANPHANQGLYRETFHLNETEANLVAQLVPKQQILVKRPDMAKVLNLTVGSNDYWLYTSHPYDRERRREAFARYGFEQGLEILAQSGPARSSS